MVVGLLCGEEEWLIVHHVGAPWLVELEVGHEVVQLRHPLVERGVGEVFVVGSKFCIPNAHFVNSSAIGVAAKDEATTNLWQGIRRGDVLHQRLVHIDLHATVL